jgi:hypothetical protein
MQVAGEDCLPPALSITLYFSTPMTSQSNKPSQSYRTFMALAAAAQLTLGGAVHAEGPQITDQAVDLAIHQSQTIIEANANRREVLSNQSNQLAVQTKLLRDKTAETGE